MNLGHEFRVEDLMASRETLEGHPEVLVDAIREAHLRLMTLMAEAHDEHGRQVERLWLEQYIERVIRKRMVHDLRIRVEVGMITHGATKADAPAPVLTTKRHALDENPW